ncbi:hypothetical protein [Okeania sp.]
MFGKLHKPGVWCVENSLSTELFEQIMQTRGFVRNYANNSVIYHVKN